MSGRRWAYTAKLVPIGVPVRIPTVKGDPSLTTTTFDETTLEWERRNANRIRVCVNHDRALDVGTLSRVYPEDGWWRALFSLDQAIDAELEIGQPMSVGISRSKWGSISLDEVSIVPRGAVRGAQVVDRLDLGPATEPSPRAAAPTPRAARATPGSWPPGTIVRDLPDGSQEITHSPDAPPTRRYFTPPAITIR